LVFLPLKGTQWERSSGLAVPKVGGKLLSPPPNRNTSEKKLINGKRVVHRKQEEIPEACVIEEQEMGFHSRLAMESRSSLNSRSAILVTIPYYD
jgi:hypothetical protein